MASQASQLTTTTGELMEAESLIKVGEMPLGCLPEASICVRGVGKFGDVSDGVLLRWDGRMDWVGRRRCGRTWACADAVMRFGGGNIGINLGSDCDSDLT